MKFATTVDLLTAGERIPTMITMRDLADLASQVAVDIDNMRLGNFSEKIFARIDKLNRVLRSMGGMDFDFLQVVCEALVKFGILTVFLKEEELHHKAIDLLAREDNDSIQFCLWLSKAAQARM